MLSKFRTFVGNSSVKTFQVSNYNLDKITTEDNIDLFDRKKNSLTLVSGIVYKCLVALADSRKISPEQYIAEFRKMLENENAEEVKKPE